MPKEIKQRIVLEGEEKYSQAIRDAQRNLRTLKSELKAETAELGANATAQQKNETRARSLKAQIKEQEQIVKTLRAALDEVKSKYGDNADEVAKWEQKLNGARATLANMKNDLERAGGGFQTITTNAAAATTATKSVADAFERLGSVGDTVAGAIESVFTGLISTIKEAATEVWALVTDTAARANNWTDLATYYGSTAQAIQMWDSSITAAGGDFSKFLNIVNQLSFGNKDAKITELLGISKENYRDDIEYTLAVLDELGRRREELGQGWYDSTMAELFGARRSADVSWFLANAHGHESSNGEWINGWRDNPERFNGNEGAYGLNDQELQDLNDVYVLLRNIETKWQSIKGQIGAGLGTAALEITASASGFLDGLAEYMNADSEEGREAALEKMRTNMERFFQGVAQIIRDCVKILTDLGEELKGSEDPATKMIGEIMSSLAGALQWMIDYQNDVKTALEFIFGAWLIAKLASVAGKLSSIVANIETIKTFRNWNVPGGSGTGTGTGTDAGDGVAGGAGAVNVGTMNVTTGSVQSETVHTMYVQNMVGGGNGTGNPVPTDTGTPDGGGYIPLPVGGGTPLIGTGSEGGNLGSGDTTLNLPAGGDVNVEGDGIHLNADEFQIDGNTGGAPAVPDISFGADTAMFDGGIGMAAGFALSEYDRITQPYRDRDEYLHGLLGKYGLDMDRPEVRKAVTEAVNPVLNADGTLDSLTVTLPADVEDRFAKIAAEYGSTESGHFYMSEGRTLDEIVEEVGNVLDKAHEYNIIMNEALREAEEEENAPSYYDWDQEDGWSRDTTRDYGTRAGLLPADWLAVTGSWNRGAGGTKDENGITSGDLQGFRSLPAGIQSAVKQGAAAGVSGIRVYLDGASVGRLVAPYVSQEIASGIA